MRNLLCITFLCLFSLQGICQGNKFRTTYYHASELGVSFLTNKKFYPEFRIKSEEWAFESARYSFLLRNDVSIEKQKNISFTWGAGFSVEESKTDASFIIPLAIRKSNLFNNENISTSIGLDIRTDSKLTARPLIGFSINF